MTKSQERDQVTPNVDDLYGQIRREILNGSLEAGSVISQVQFAKRLKVNRTPLREALRMLQREGLVEGEYNRRVRISKLTILDLEELYASRIAQEAIAIRLSVPRFSEADFRRMRDLLAQMDATSTAENLNEWEVPHKEFHRMLTVHSGERIYSVVHDLSDYCERYRRALLRQRPTISYAIGAEEHLAILEACERRDAIGAPRLLARHLGRTALSLISISDPEHDPAAVRESLKVITGETAPPTPFRSGT